MGEPCRRRALCRVARGVGRNVAWGLTEGGGEGGAHEWSLGWGGLKSNEVLMNADELLQSHETQASLTQSLKSYTKSHTKLSTQRSPHKALHTKLSTHSSPHPHTSISHSYKYFPLVTHLFPPTCHLPSIVRIHQTLGTHTHTHTHLASPPVHSSLSRSFPSCAEKPLGYGGTQLQMTMRSGGQCAQRGRRRSGRLPMGGPAAMRGRRPSGIPSSSPRTQRENPSLAPLRMQEHWLRQRR